MNNTLCRAARCVARSPACRITRAGAQRWSSSNQKTWSTPLAKTITDAINTTGPISIASYMRLCLTSPDGGYYTSQGDNSTEVFGRKGDFITSPEISQIFGELLGIWMVAEWMAQGRKRSGVQLIEVGPGKGTLMDDMLRSARNFRSFSSSVEAVFLVEESPTLRDVQKKLLCGDSPMVETELGYQSTSKHLEVPIIWTEDIRTLPKGEDKTPFIFAHEFFDALPIHAFKSVAPSPDQSQSINTPTGPAALHKPLPTAATTPQWRELLVTSNPKYTEQSTSDEPEFQLSLAKASTPSSLVMPEKSERYKALKSKPESLIEISSESQSYVQDFARRIGGGGSTVKEGDRSGTSAAIKDKPSGAALILDYGTSSTVPINSLRGIRSHKRVSPFSFPGQVDVSADVDFTALAEAAIEASPGVEAYGPVEQGDFLLSLGIEQRAEQLLKHVKDEAQRKNIETGWKRLVERGGGGMGKIYKALTIVPESGGKRRPVGFGGGVGNF